MTEGLRVEWWTLTYDLRVRERVEGNGRAAWWMQPGFGMLRHGTLLVPSKLQGPFEFETLAPPPWEPESVPVGAHSTTHHLGWVHKFLALEGQAIVLEDSGEIRQLPMAALRWVKEGKEDEKGEVKSG